MIERIIEFSIRNRFLVLLGMLVVVGWGIYSIGHTPIDAIPDLSENQVIVFADWMGRSPQEIEDQVTYPLSVNLQGLAGVKTVRATSEFNFSMIDIIFEDKVDFYFARQRVLERLSIASTFLPQGVVPYLAPDATALGQIFWYTVEGEGKDLGELRSIQDWYVRYQLNSVPGVAEVSSVGGFIKTYEIAIDPNRLRTYDITLGQVVSAIQRSNSAVGGNVFVQNDAEYLIRGIGWIRGLEDIRNTVITSREGVPVTVGLLGAVQLSPQARRSVLEKNGQEAVGGVVLMRYGENPLEITQRIKKKIESLQPGLPPGVRIVAFYDRTHLIKDAIHTVTRTLKEEIVIASIAILLILTHFGSALVVVVTLPLAVLVSFILMHLFGIPSNIMSLSGIAISIGILVDAAIVMVENATHELTAEFGHERVRGDTRETILRASKLVGRPIFLSVMIMLISFLPVFALSGQEGKMFHPLAFTKSFAMVGVALLAITLVPAMMPVFLRGRLHSELDNPIVRSFIEIYKPVLNFLLRHRKAFVWSFVVLLGVGFNLSRHLGREFMPPLDEGSVMDMPVTIPSVSVAKAGDDLISRNAILRSFPEVSSVVGKAGRAETATDPAPPDMVETIINLHPRSWWPKRKIRFEDTMKEAGILLGALQQQGVVRKALSGDERGVLLNEASMAAVERMDGILRTQAREAETAFTPNLGRDLAAAGVKRVVDMARRQHALSAGTDPGVIRGIEADLARNFGMQLAVEPDAVVVNRLLAAARDSLMARGAIQTRGDIFRPERSRWASISDPVRTVLGGSSQTVQEAALASIEKSREKLWKKAMRDENDRLADRAPKELVDALTDALTAGAATHGLVQRDLTDADRAGLWARREKALRRGLFLWHKTKADIVQEFDTALQVPGWGNIWTQPIINRVDMLATGVRTMVGVKVFGDDLYKIQDVSQQVAGVLKGIPGAVDVFPDQIVGENYLEIDVDRVKAARYGVNVGDVQDVIEVALGGMTVTNTVEGRRRFPVRVRYARDFRTDAEEIGKTLVSSGGSATGGAQALMGSTMSTAVAGAGAAGPVQVPLSAVAAIRVTQGPSMIKSENGMLRSYVQLNVRGRDVVGFVEEAQRLVAENVQASSGLLRGVERSVRTPSPCEEDPIDRLSSGDPTDLPDPLSDLPRSGARVADGPGSARSPRRRRDLSEDVRLQFQRGGLGWIYRGLRDGDGDRNRHDGVPARCAPSQGGIGRNQERGRDPRGRRPGSRPPIAAEALDGRGRHRRTDADALGARDGRGGHAPDGGPGPRRASYRRRGHRPPDPRSLPLGRDESLAADECDGSRGDGCLTWNAWMGRNPA